jgi:hypothetical protein
MITGRWFAFRESLTALSAKPAETNTAMIDVSADASGLPTWPPASTLSPS